MIFTIPANVCRALPFDVAGYAIDAGFLIRIVQANACAI